MSLPVPVLWFANEASVVPTPRYSVWAKPLSDEFVVIDTVPEPDVITDAPSLLRLPSGKLLCACPRLVVDGANYLAATRERLGSDTLSVYTSPDHGGAWKELDRLPFLAGRLFLHGGSAFYLGVGPERRGIWITRSDGDGERWTEPVQLFEGLFYAAASGMAERDGRLYWSFGAANTAGRFNAEGSQLMAVAGDLSADLTSPAAWRRSNDLEYPGTPAGLVQPSRLYDMADHWLEPNVVNVGDRVRVIARLRLDHYSTSGMAAVCDLADDGERLNLSFTQFYPMPGAQNHFHIIHDELTRLYWMISNLPTRTQDLVYWEAVKRHGFKGPPGNERRFLMLFYGVDALNWFPAGCVAMWPSPSQAFNYTTPLIDGEDMLIVSRTSRSGRNQHDNDLVTFHRLPNFRSLALDLFPEL